jgi:soluble lytic murein transglycosylase
MSRCSGGIIRARLVERWWRRAQLLAALAFTLGAQDVSQLARSYADNPDLINKSALLKYAAAHKDSTGALALLAVGALDFRADRRGEVMRNLNAARDRLPMLADYIAYLSASASFADRDFKSSANWCEAVLKQQPKSPLAGQAAMLAAKAYIAANTPARAVEVLQRAHADLTQPDGDAALAGAFDAMHDAANALAFDQRVWLEYPASPQAKDAEVELPRLRAALGSAYRPPASSALLARASKLMDARDYARARREFADLAAATSGSEHDLALVRIGDADRRARKEAIALSYLDTLQVGTPEADAERLYYLLAAARRLNRLDVMARAVSELAGKYPKSEWRLQALVAAGNEYFLLNKPQEFEPLFESCHQQFQQYSQASYCHWRLAFSRYLQNREDSGTLLKAHLKLYPDSEKASGALYFLGRLAERSSNPTEARAWYDRLAASFPNYYYAVLARQRRAQTTLSQAGPAEQVAEFLRGIDFPARRLQGSFEPVAASQPRFERARLLQSAALDEFAEIELRFGAKGGEQPQAFGLELARLASSRSAPERAIRYLKRYAPGYLLSPMDTAPRAFWQLAFPLPWREPLFQYSQQAGLDPFMVAALIRQESEFDRAVVSHANAYGLTQIVPATGRELSRRLGIRGFSTKMLLEPEVNLRLGTEYLRSLLSQFNGEWEPALASYNAGKSRVVAWQGRTQYREPAEFVESIPFSETRAYVQIVIRNADLYRRLYEASK